MTSPLRLVKPGQLTVGVDAAAPLPLHTDPAQPPMVGFDIDLIQQIALRLNLTIVYRSALWRDIIEDMQQSRTDLICSASTITQDRKKILDVSEPYLDISLAIVTQPGSLIKTADDLNQKVIGVRVSTSAETFINDHLQAKSVITFDMNTDAYQALKDGQVDAVIDDSPIAGHFAKTLGLALAGTIPGTEAQYGLLFKKGNHSLQQAVNEVLVAIQKDGTYESMQRKWLVTD